MTELDANKSRVTESQEQGDTKHTLVRLLTLLVAIVVIAGLLAVAWMFVPAKYKYQSTPLTKLYYSMLHGDLETVLALQRAIQDDPRASADEKASATLSALGSEFRISRDPAALLTDVRNLKKGILDEGVSSRLRARLIAALATQYASSGGDQAVYREIFLDPPFNTYLVSGDTEASVNNLYLWSHSITPTAYAAIRVAEYHSAPKTPRVGRATWTMTDSAATEAVRYLEEANRLSTEEIAMSSTHVQSAQYLWYRYWRAVVIGRLADKLGEPYQSQYRKEYDEFISFAKGHPAVLAEEAVPFARFEYAIRLLQDRDREATARQLVLLAQDMGAMQYPDANGFALFLRSVHRAAPDGVEWLSTRTLTQLSPEFKAAVETVVGTSIE